MGILSKFLRRLKPSKPEGPSSQHPSVMHTAAHSQASGMHTGAPASPNGVRKDIIRVVLKQTLTHNGIPSAWLGAEPLVTKSRDQTAGLHIRFLIRHWDTRLMQHAFDFQEDFNDRLQAFDPEADNWLLGYSWQFKVPGLLPGGMPHPGSWTSWAKDAGPDMSREVDTLPGGSADVIAGPVIISRQPASSSANVRADLEALMALHLPNASHPQRSVHAFAPTEPSKLSKE